MNRRSGWGPLLGLPEASLKAPMLREDPSCPVKTQQRPHTARSTAWVCVFNIIIYKAIQWIRDRAAVQKETAYVYIHSYPEHSLQQGLYKVAEAIGTMIQNIKYISIYKYTAEDCGGPGMDSGRGFPSRGPERQGWDNQGVRNFLHWL